MRQEAKDSIEKNRNLLRGLAGSNKVLSPELVAEIREWFDVGTVHVLCDSHEALRQRVQELEERLINNALNHEEEVRGIRRELEPMECGHVRKEWVGLSAREVGGGFIPAGCCVCQQLLQVKRQARLEEANLRPHQDGCAALLTGAVPEDCDEWCGKYNRIAELEAGGKG